MDEENKNKAKEIFEQSIKSAKDALEKSGDFANEVIEKTSKKTKELGEMATINIELAKDAHDFKIVIAELGNLVYQKFAKEEKQIITLEECQKIIEKAKRLDNRDL